MRTSKRCYKCGVTKPLEDFHRDRHKRDGHQDICKGCTKIRRAAYEAAHRAPRKEPPPIDPVSKYCRKCNTTKLREEFYPNRKARDGLMTHCKECHKARTRAFYREPIHREKHNAAHRSRYAQDPELRAWLSEYSRHYREVNPHIMRKATSKRRALKLSSFVEAIDKNVVFESDGWVCRLCGGPIERELRWPDSGFASVDHILPMSQGGLEAYDNVQAAHLRCNRKKHNHLTFTPYMDPRKVALAIGRYFKSLSLLD